MQTNETGKYFMFLQKISHRGTKVWRTQREEEKDKKAQKDKKALDINL